MQCRSSLQATSISAKNTGSGRKSVRLKRRMRGGWALALSVALLHVGIRNSRARAAGCRRLSHLASREGETSRKRHRVLEPSKGRRCRGSPFGTGLELRLVLLLPSCPRSAINCDGNPLPSEIKLLCYDFQSAFVVFQATSSCSFSCSFCPSYLSH